MERRVFMPVKQWLQGDGDGGNSEAATRSGSARALDSGRRSIAAAAGGRGPSRAPRASKKSCLSELWFVGQRKPLGGAALHHAGVRQGDFYYCLALTHVALTTCWPPSSLRRPTLSTATRCQLAASHSRRFLSTSASCLWLGSSLVLLFFLFPHDHLPLPLLPERSTLLSLAQLGILRSGWVRISSPPDSSPSSCSFLFSLIPPSLPSRGSNWLARGGCGSRSGKVRGTPARSIPMHTIESHCIKLLRVSKCECRRRQRRRKADPKRGSGMPGHRQHRRRRLSCRLPACPTQRSH
ncbi:hypothetical protein E2C01_006486 [Portunus trituberculatus]|uniref:Uncharacterized protein n=1 Tax=Portunus trituberculatus TaxID=210409 RepID=A0A5B7CY04_PORTR|nr:hypothetical protein [Portunus trituberculatus]